MDIVSLLRDSGLRATKSRIAVLSFLEQQRVPISISEIAEKLGAVVDPVTVYRIIDAAKGAGIVKEVNLGTGSISYELAPDGHGHHHVVCTSCHKIADVSSCHEELLSRDALKEARGFASITGHSLEFFGLCKSCS
ncbi:transcriptional repressor [Candidatus Kaiserbacteria bacterium]|nr:transcriptional repressor [Candidatus Kaiserbacteria bacterium]